jgi:hypothetical protein
MRNWKSLLNRDATDWLLEEPNPSVRYFALRWLLAKSERDKDVVSARQAIGQSAPIQKIVERQRPEGYWGSDARPHHGTRGPLMLLLWLGAPKSAAIEKAMNYCLAGCLLENGAYGIRLKGRMVLLPCHGAEFLRLMLQYGYTDDPRSRNLLNWLVGTQQADGVWRCPSKVKPFPCLWATADILRAFRDLPRSWLTASVKAARDRAVELFLNSALCQYGKHKPSLDWFRFGYPLRWTSDVLDVLESVAPYVTPGDQRIRDGLSLVLSKQDSEGRWACEKRPKGGKWIEAYIELEKVGEPSKWVTLHVYRMLQTLFAQ